MSQPNKRERRIRVGDILLLTYTSHLDDKILGNLLARVTTVNSTGWVAQQLVTLGGYEFPEDCLWHGPDPRSWKSVTNLGPCIPAELSETDVPV